jgi:hypothetical protein
MPKIALFYQAGTDQNYMLKILAAGHTIVVLIFFK